MSFPLISEEATHPKDRLDLWAGKFGTAYHKANPFNAGSVELRRKWLWGILRNMPDGPPMPASILEVGCGQGENLAAWRILRPDARIVGLEPNAYAASEARMRGLTIIEGDVRSFTEHELARDGFDLVMASGVLIHVPTEGLPEIMSGMHHFSRRYILSSEYFSFREQEMPYREKEACWTRPYGDIWMDLFSLRPVQHGYLWDRITALDNLTWQLFEKQAAVQTSTTKSALPAPVRL